MEDFLKWFSDNNWCQYKDGKYYQRGAYRPWRPTKYYTQKESILNAYPEDNIK